MECKVEQQGAVTVLAVAGTIDVNSTPHFIEVLDQQIAAGHLRLVLDLAQLDYISSAGLRAVLSAVKKVRPQNGDVRLAAIPGPAFKIFDIAGFTDMLRSYADTAAAIASFGA